MTDFLALHRPGEPLLMPNAYDVGSARILAGMGFAAVATTSGGFAATIGRHDGEVGRDEAVAHGAALQAAVAVPVSADLEDGFGARPEEVAATVAMARAAGLAGCSVEDHTRDPDDPVHDLALARDRIAAAAEAAHQAARATADSATFVLTARADGHLYGHTDLAETVARLQAYQEAGADVLYAPGLRTPAEIETVCAEVDRPVNVLLVPGGPRPDEIAAAGAARISVGGAFAWAAYTGLVEAAEDLRDGSVAYLDRTAPGRRAFDRGLGRG